MKTLSPKTLGLFASLGLAAALPATAVQAAPWSNINSRQANLDARIDQGVRSGALTRPEAARLRADFRALTGLEFRYRRTGGGLSAWERADLNRRFDALSARVYVNKHDWQNRRGRRY